ncbi:hypothetical protein FD35_GL000016 [Furfurilactobacillus rossiae DSM 15814]|uniref:Uncharacterized protein n=3 Tax=Furfurilactobacillus TaxID=2767882 RepID=A0A0R1RT71_9LACO|nr:hypothetical protein FD35_GL000016 [Furfurilactobacillus rossiae DSM 15814]
MEGQQMETEAHRNIITSKLRRLFKTKAQTKEDRTVIVPSSVRSENHRFDQSLFNSLLSLQFARIDD